MTEPVITINGRTLIPEQVKAVRGALLLADGAIDAIYDADRLTEVLQIMEAKPSERVQQEKMLSGMFLQRRQRILQLAGIVPEQATPEQIRLADGYAAAGIQIDEAAVRLQTALTRKA